MSFLHALETDNVCLAATYLQEGDYLLSNGSVNYAIEHNQKEMIYMFSQVRELSANQQDMIFLWAIDQGEVDLLQLGQSSEADIFLKTCSEGVWDSFSIPTYSLFTQGFLVALQKGHFLMLSALSKRFPYMKDLRFYFSLINSLTDMGDMRGITYVLDGLIDEHNCRFCKDATSLENAFDSLSV